MPDHVPNMKLPSLSGVKNGSNHLDALAYEAAHETAITFGRTGKKLEMALEKLKQYDATVRPNTDRAVLLQEAADAAWGFFIQRDHLGLRTDHHLLQTYNIPDDVMARVGIFKQMP